MCYGTILYTLIKSTFINTVPGPSILINDKAPSTDAYVRIALSTDAYVRIARIDRLAILSLTLLLVGQDKSTIIYHRPIE